VQRLLLPWGDGRGPLPHGVGRLIDGSGCVTYSEARETSGTAEATVIIYDGDSANGRVLAEYRLWADQSTSESQQLHVLPYDQGIYVDLASGAAVGSITVWADHCCRQWLMDEHIAAIGAMAVDAQELAR
jgi:hypothetical protein